jgi:hypothetical protein
VDKSRKRRKWRREENLWSYEEVVEELLRRKPDGPVTIRSDELPELFGYSPDVPRLTIRRRLADLKKWAKQKLGCTLVVTHYHYMTIELATAAKEPRRQKKGRRLKVSHP